MEKELLNVLKTNKDTRSLIEDTIEVVKEKRGLRKEIKMVIPSREKCDELPKNFLAQYDHQTQEIHVFPENFKASIYKLENNFISLDLQEEIENGKKLFIMQLILHELEHAYQRQLSLDENNNSPYAIISKDYYKQDQLKNKLRKILEELADLIIAGADKAIIERKKIEVEMQMSILTSQENLTYLTNHDLFPIERAADINAYRILTNVLSLSEYKRLYHYLSTKKIFTEIKDYEKGMSPLLRYVYETNNGILIEQLEPSLGTMSLDERILYGVDITDEELKQKSNEMESHALKI